MAATTRHGAASPTRVRARLRERIGGMISRGAAAERSDDAFNALALDVFRYQAEANPIYGAFVRNRGLDPQEVSDWREIPAVPTRAFKELPLACDGAEPEATFRTSGTTGGERDRGQHRIRDLSLYRASLLATASAHLRPEPAEDGTQPSSDRRTPPPVRFLGLLPDPESIPDSSLLFMARTLLEAWDDGRGGYFAEPDWTLRSRELAGALAEATGEGTPILMVGTAFAYVHWLEQGGTAPAPIPRGSVLMETGGYKGRSRAVPRRELYDALHSALGLPPDRMVNEYGMTELLSQFYEPVLREGGPADVGARRHVGPPWVRSRVLTPSTLRPAAAEEPGLLCHLDLANLDSVAAVLTEDMGVAVEDGFRLLGRAEGAEPRGCSLTMEELLVAGGEAG